MTFFERGLMARAFKGFKLYVQVAGNKMYEKKVKELITLEVTTQVEEKKHEIEFLEQLIAELEE